MHVETHTQPLFVDQAAALIKVLKTKTADDISELMSLSPALSELNVQRYAHWKRTFTQANSRQAVLAFNGDVYEGLEASTLSAKQLDWAQEHVAILSGLYGVLRPLDLMQPYRLEMGTRLETSKGKEPVRILGQRHRRLPERTPGRAEGAGHRQPGVRRVFQGGRPEGAQGARGAVRVPGLEERRLEDHQLPRQARAA